MTESVITLANRKATGQGRASNRRLQFIAAATKLMGESGFHGMTTEQLAREAGVSVGLVYKYFAKKEDILLAVIVSVLDAYATEVPRAIALGKNTLEKLFFSFTAYCLVVDQERRAAILAYRESKTLTSEGLSTIKAMEQSTTALFAELIKRGMDEGIFIECNPMLVAYDIVMLGHMWALKHWNFRDSMLVEDFILGQMRLVFSALLSRADRDIYLPEVSLMAIARYRRLRRNEVGPPSPDARERRFPESPENKSNSSQG